MADHEVMRFRLAFDDVKTGMADLKKSLHEINALLDAERYVSTEMIESLDIIMKRYREQAATDPIIGWWAPTDRQ